jgi:hypothetical protein
VTYFEPPPIIDPKDVPAFHRLPPFDTERYLYHYTRWERLLDIAHSGALRLSPVTSMNDPRETKRWFMSHATFDTTPPGAASGLWEAAEDFRRLVKVAAFATDRPGDNVQDIRFGAGYARPRMWAQYAANHTGVCIIFERADLVERLAARFRGGANSGTTHFTSDHVRYVREEALTAIGVGDAPLTETVEAYFLHQWKDAFYVKHEDWRDENEFRMAVYERGNADPLFVDARGAVAGLVLGVDFKDEHLSVARTFNDALAVDGRVGRISWDRVNHRLLPIAIVDYRWTVSRFTGAVVASWHFGAPQQMERPEYDQ